MWKPGDRLIHRFNGELGPGIVVSVDIRTLTVEFPSSGTRLRLAAGTEAIVPLELLPGTRARLISTGEAVVIGARPDGATATLDDGRTVAVGDLWPVDRVLAPLERLAQGRIDHVETFATRLDALHLTSMREAGGLGPFLGGRIQLFPHQLYVAERATRALDDGVGHGRVRWLLADEVGLGKTVEACLIANRLIRAGRAHRTLVIAPETLTVQWLGELWRKYHQVFVLLDEKRLEDVATDFGAGFNPFDAHRRVVLGLELLLRNPTLSRQAVDAGLDLVIVDEAHHLRRPLGHPGNAEYRAVAPIVAASPHALLLTATPLDEDAHGFFRLLQMLRPDEFPDDASLTGRLAARTPLPPCTSSTRRRDIGGLPPRVGRAIEADAVSAGQAGWTALAALEAALSSPPAQSHGAGNAAQRAERMRRLRRALESGSAADAVARSGEQPLKAVARTATRLDPRTAWLSAQAGRWKRAGDRTLVFVAHRETLDEVKTALETVGQVRVGLFHEALAPARRDLEVAQFRQPDGPSILLSTECGGEGRNFEFCTRLVLFDLPWDPTVVEQRIGRLDRIGRHRPVEIVYFRPPSGIGAAVVHLYERLGLFRVPLGGLDRELGRIEAAIEAAALETPPPFPPGVALDRQTVEARIEERFGALIAETHAARDRATDAAYHELHREPYRPELAEAILARVPADLDTLTAAVVLGAAGALNLHVEEQRGTAAYSIELGRDALVDNLPGVAGGTSFRGSFDRAQAVENEALDYFASGHPLVEGLLAEMEDSPRGRVALLDLQASAPDPGGRTNGAGLLALYRGEPGFVAVVIDESGAPRPEWAALCTRRPLRARGVRPDTWTSEPGWETRVRRAAAQLPGPAQPIAVAWVRLRFPSA